MTPHPIGDRGLLRTGLVAIIALVMPLTTVQAQTERPISGTALSLNPLGLPFMYVAVEFERRMVGAASFGLSASYAEPKDVAYATVEGKLRVYPAGGSPHGLSLGVSGGFAHVAEKLSPSITTSDAGPTVGAFLDYNFYAGKSKRVLVGIGAGAKRILINDKDKFTDAEFSYPTFRFQIGRVF